MLLTMLLTTSSQSAFWTYFHFLLALSLPMNANELLRVSLTSAAVKLGNLVGMSV